VHYTSPLVSRVVCMQMRVVCMQIKSAIPPRVLRVVSRDLPKLSREAGQRLKYIKYYETHERNASLTCRHFGISRPTFYRWLHRYNPHDLRSLEDRVSQPKHRRQPTWTRQLVEAVRRLREQYPSWGKDKLVVLLRRQGLKVSTSMVGRILKHLKQTHQLIEPPRFAVSAKKRRLKRVYATRKPKEYQAQEPGDIVQVDTLDVRPLPGVIRKQFTARDVVSRYDVLDIRSQATAKLASQFVEAVIGRMPFPIKAIQVDNGSEFMAEFEEVCQARGLKLFVLPPRSPKLNGHVERAQRTHTEEHWELSVGDTDVESMRRELREWEEVYNTVRPHQALRYLTPLEYVNIWKAKQPTSQVV
jgi:putative transposase